MSCMTHEEDALDILEQLGKLPEVIEHGTRKLDVFSLSRAMTDYLEHSSTESDGFLVGLDSTEAQAKALFKDFLIYVTQCDEFYLNTTSL